MDFLGLPLLPSEQQPAPSEKVPLLMSCEGLWVKLHCDQHCNHRHLALPDLAWQSLWVLRL